MTGAVFMILFIKNHIIWFPSVQHCNWFGFRISLSLSREGAIFRDEIENYFSCSRLARRDRDYHMTILVFRDENEIPFCYSHVSRRDRDFRKSFLVVEREKMKLTLVENSRDREFSLTSGANHFLPGVGAPVVLQRRGTMALWHCCGTVPATYVALCGTVWHCACYPCTQRCQDAPERPLGMNDIKKYIY